jgi:hypothetical protein
VSRYSANVLAIGSTDQRVTGQSTAGPQSGKKETIMDPTLIFVAVVLALYLWNLLAPKGHSDLPEFIVVPVPQTERSTGCAPVVMFVLLILLVWLLLGGGGDISTGTVGISVLW